MPRRAVQLLVGAAGGLVLLALTWLAAFHLGFVQHADQSLYREFAMLRFHHERVGTLAWRLATLCDPQPYVYLCAVPVAVALLRRRLWVASAVVAILLGANMTTQLLKALLAHPRAASLLGGLRPPDAASWPSGHATAAMSLALCIVLAAPARARPALAALGAAFAVGVSYSFLALMWHYPTDVLGGFLVATIWTLVGAAAVYTATARQHAGGPVAARAEPARRLSLREVMGPPGVALAGSLGLALVLVLVRPHQVVSYTRAHELFVAGAAGIGVLALLLATGVTLALRR